MKEKVSVDLKNCRPGMMMAETIYNSFGAVIVWENTVLTGHIILKLRELGLESVLITKDGFEKIKRTQGEIFTEDYNKGVQTFKNILFDVSSGKNVDLNQISHISNSVQKKINDNRSIIDCINQVRSVDEYTYHHCINVSMICMLIGKWMGLDSKDISDLITAGLLHDVGKGKVPGELLNKPNKLNRIEFEEMKKHSEYGYLILQESGTDPKISEAVLTHHEREDGTGYPMGLKGNEISLFAKIIAVADIFDAMTANRAYKMKDTPFEVFDLMQNGSFGFLDHQVLNSFLSNIIHYYIGQNVLLNNGLIAEIIYFDTRNISRPLVKVGEEYIDLNTKRDISIVELL